MLLTPEAYLARFEQIRAARIDSPDEFASESVHLVRGSAEVLANSRLTEADQKFLVELGLADDISPFNFYGLPDGPLLMWEFEPQREWTPEAKRPFESLRLLGGNDNGDPLFVDEITGHIVTLNHDWDFRREFVNSSIPQFANCLLLNGLAMVNPNDQLRLKENILAIDPQAVQPGHFWNL